MIGVMRIRQWGILWTGLAVNASGAKFSWNGAWVAETGRFNVMVVLTVLIVIIILGQQYSFRRHGV
jgi:hypothetical protein